MEITEPPSTEPLQEAIQAGFISIENGISLLIILMLIICSGLISGSEAAFFSLSPSDKDELKGKNDKASLYIRKLLDKPKELLATILIANNFVNVGIVILSSTLLGDFYDSWENANPDAITKGALLANETFRFIIDVVGITFFLLLFGEVIPKIYGNKNSIRFAMLMARPLYIVNGTPPVSWLRMALVSGSTVIQKRSRKSSVKISTDELEQALALTRDQAESADDHKILEDIVKFGNTEVRQIMKSRMDVYAIDARSKFKEVLEMILECGHSRIPVYEENFDNVIGILFIKDLLPFLSKENLDWVEKIRKPFFVTENKKIDDLLKEFQGKKVHMAIVVDEYGGASGIVTLEDVLEEIVGEITDEFDDDEIIYTKIDEYTYLFEGRTTLVDFYKVMDIESFVEENKVAETLGGFIVESAGRILMNNEFIIAGDIKLIVESSDKKRIKMVKAVKLNKIVNG